MQNVPAVFSGMRSYPAPDAIYFQGAIMDPLPIIQRLEETLSAPVIATNPAMIWHLLSKLEVKDSVKGYGKLLAEWPAPEGG